MPGVAGTHRLARLYNNVAREELVYPTLAAGATVVSAAVNWTYGDYATIIPAAAIAVPFDIQSISIETCDKTAIFELQLYKGASDEIIATKRFAFELGFYGNSVYLVSGANIEAGARIRARLASSAGGAGAATITMSVSYILT